MALTSLQLQALKTAIDADPALSSQPLNTDGALAIQAAFLATASPDFWVWRTSVTKREIVTEVSQDATSFVWAGNGFITRSAGELECWNQLFNSTLTCNPSLANVRQAFQDIFSGSGNAASNRAHLLAVARRKANRGEKLFATGTGSTGSPATMVVEGAISVDDIHLARALP